MIRHNGQLIVAFGGYPVPSPDWRRGCLILGVTGSGKGLFVNIMLSQLLTDPTTLERMVFNDAKTEAVTILRALGVEPTICHPFDRRAVFVDIAQACLDDPAGAPELIAEALLPTSDGDQQNPHWHLSARMMVAGGIRSLHYLAPGKWSFHHLILLFRTESGIRRLLSACPLAAHLAARITGSDEWGSVFATLNTLLDRYSTLAACWRLGWKNGRTISLRRWAEGTPSAAERVILLGNDESRKQSTAANARIVVGMAKSSLISSGRKRRDDAVSWFILDEFPDLGRIEGMAQFVSKARSYGVATVLCAQCVSSFDRDYGKQDASLLTGNPGCVAAFKPTTATAAWLSELSGDVEEWVESVGFRGAEMTTNHSPQIRPGVLKGEYLKTPYPSANGSEGWFFYDNVLWTHNECDWPPLPADTTDNYQPVPAQELILEPLTIDELELLNLPTTSEAIRDFCAVYSNPFPWDQHS